MSEQIIITVRLSVSDEIKLKHHKNKTVLETLREGGIKLPSLCGLSGKCGKCAVRFLHYAPLPTQADRLSFEPDKLREGYRLSCMAKPTEDSILEIMFLEDQDMTVVAENFWERKDAEGGAALKTEAAKTNKRQKTYIAADLGTTTIVMQLIGFSDGKVIDTYTCLNSQAKYGADVISRIQSAGSGNAEMLQTEAEEALKNGMEQLCLCCDAKKICKPKKMILAGNTTMIHLLLGYETKFLGRSPFRAININKISCNVNNMETIIIPGISAFIGGDIVAGLYACDLHNAEENVLFLDFGTNAEMVLYDRTHLICTAAAAGPAFENAGGSGGYAAERIHAVAELLKDGMIDRQGLLKEPYFENGIKRSGVCITQKDIRDLQMAKAAVRAGIQYLLIQSGLNSYEEIDKIYLAGGFGFYLNEKAAVTVGLIPEEFSGKTTAVGNAALAGTILYGWKEEGRLEKIVEIAASINMAEQQDFETVYIKYLDF